MKISAVFARKIFPFSFLPLLLAAFLFWQFSPRAESARTAPATEIQNYDIRTDESEAARAALTKFLTDAGKTEALVAAQWKKFARAEQNLRDKGTKLNIEPGAELRAPEVIAPDFTQNAGFITAPSAGKRADILKNFLKENNELIGLTEAQIDALETAADYTNPNGALSFVHFEQKIGGVPVFPGELKAGFTRRNEIVRVINNLAPGLEYESVSRNFEAAEAAVEAAAKTINLPLDQGDLKQNAALSNDLKITFERGNRADEITAEKIYFPVEIGAARAAWRVALWTETEAFFVIVDARDKTLLWRKKLTENQTQPATYNVYGNAASLLKTADSPTAFSPGCLTPLACPEPPIIARQTFTLVGNEPPYTFNNLGWMTDNTNCTAGNNAEAGLDRVSPNGVDACVPGEPNRVFNFSYNPAPGNPPPGDEPLDPTFQKGSVTNAFYVANRWHDETYLLGFTEAARNFQTDNFGRGGTGNDSISVEVQDSSGFNSANFFAPPDGMRPRIQLFIWNTPTPDRDGALDNQIVVHELTHGLSSRLHGNSSGLGPNMARGMGEGWSDFYALALLSEPADNTLGIYPFLSYASFGAINAPYYYGVRRFPYAVREAVGANGFPYNPLTFANLNAGNCSNFQAAFPPQPATSAAACDSVHFVGEVWASALWEVRRQLILQHGAAEGNRRALQYVTDGMKLSPLNPNMLQSRDAIIAAASASDQTDVLPIRRGFAARGLGFSASIQNPGTGSNNTVVTESFEANANVVIGAGFAANDSTGNNNGYFEQGETIQLVVPLTNNTGAAISNVTLQAGSGTSVVYGTIANGETVTRNVNFTIPATAPCPGDYAIALNISSSTGARTETRSIFLGVPFPGTSPVTFTNSTPLTIPSTGASVPYGTTLEVSGVSGNRRIKLELTGFSHTFPGDVDVLLVGPNGAKFVVMSDAVSAFSTQTNANVVLKDNAALTLPSTGVGMNGEWKPTNYDTTTDNFPSPAPVSPYNSPAPAGAATFSSVFGMSGAALNGTWTLYVIDDVSGDSGSLAGWKLTFEPNDYICPPFCRLCTPIRARGDFDGDGKTDVSVFRPSEGNWYLNRSTAGFTVANWGLSGDRLVPGDFDGDGKADVAVFRPHADASQPDFYVLNSFNLTYAGYSWGLPGDVPVIEDYDGDGKADITVFRPSNHTFYVLRSSNGSLLTYSGITEGTPAAGDFDGDGKGDFAAYAGSGWYLSSSIANYATVGFTPWGLANDVPVPADYDGDGKDDFAVFRPSDRTWYVRKSGGGNAFVQWGLETDVPVPGDYDGDGKADIAVYRAGTWYLLRSTSGVAITQFGLGGDTPVPNRYLP